MGGWIRRGWIWRFWGAPIFHPETKTLENKHVGTSGLKIGVPKTPNPTTTDPTPHARPSERNFSGEFRSAA